MRKLKRLPKPEKLWEFYPSSVPAEEIPYSLQHATDVCFYTNDVIAVADSEGHKITLFDMAREHRTTVAPERVWPNGLAKTNNGKIWATDRQNKDIKLFDPRGDVIARLTYDYDPDEETFLPHGVAVTSRGEIVVTDTGSHQVLVYSADGKLARTFGKKGNDVGKFLLPFFCTVNRKDEILVSDNMNYCIKVFDRQGNYLRKIGSGQDWGQRQFQCPYGVAVDHEENVLVSDWDNNRILMFDQQGAFLANPITKIDGCTVPCGLAASVDGKLAFTECAYQHSNVKLFRCCEKDSYRQIETVC